MIIASIVVTIGLMLLNLIYWLCVQPELRKLNVKKRELEQLTENLIKKESKEKDDEEMQWAKQQAHEYAGGYAKWMDSITNHELDEEINTYLK